MELIVGCRNKTELCDLAQFLQQFQIIPLDAATGNKSTELLHEYRLSHGLPIPDSPIAATAMVTGIAFVSRISALPNSSSASICGPVREQDKADGIIK